MIWFTADTHFGHRLMAQQRGFSDIDAMDHHILTMWNETVAPSDVVYHLGDFSFHKKEETRRIWSQLHGSKHIVLGNHDRHKYLPSDRVLRYYTLKHESYRFVLFHYPIESWQQKHYGAIHLHGHSHGHSRPEPNRLDVGWDVFHQPISLPAVLCVIQARLEGHRSES